MLCVIYILMLTVQNISSVMNSVLSIIANYGFESATMVQRCYIRLFTLKICMNHINQSNFIRAKFTRRNGNWRAPRIHNTQFHWVGRGHRGHAYLTENKRTSQGGPTGDEREHLWESPVDYRRCHTHLYIEKKNRVFIYFMSIARNLNILHYLIGHC